jgi:uncharacterized protein
MKICLKTYARLSDSEHAIIDLKERLPTRINVPCHVTCDFSVAKCDTYYLLTLKVMGDLSITCQRCMDEFKQAYANESQLAICANDAMAERLMNQFDCVVAVDDQIDLSDIVADDLHLYAPEKHMDTAECSDEIRKWM